MEINGSAITVILSSIVGIIGAISGFVKIFKDANQASRASSSAESEQITEQYKGIANEFLRLREEDRYTFDRKIEIVKKELEGKIEALSEENANFRKQREEDVAIIAHLVKRVVYLTNTLRKIAPEHKIEPLEKAIETLIKEHS